MDFEALHEGRMHGDVLFPLSVYKVELVNGLFFSYHWHREIELIYMTYGSALFHIGTDTVILQQGEGLLIPSGQLHASYPDQEQPAYFHAIVCDPQLLSSSTYDAIQNKYLSPWLERKLLLPDIYRRHTAWERSVLHYMEDMMRQYEGKPAGFELKIKADLLAIFAELLPHSEHSSDLPGISSDAKKIERIKPVLSYIRENYKERLPLGELAALVAMSEGHFCRFFKSIVKKTPVEYINSLRIEQAIRCLENPHTKIIDIASEVGFESPSYFIKTFKALKGMTPTDYRHAFMEQARNHAD
ncbi:AraC family transcriptional regulator [Paenibacillus hexagrammi]|uniref:AraC family transcriptional regulator n=1 Tax=Paenibacillus hexagrammi TaxID=2908839 RepID=A0ABY3SH00_9BACL|nr:AraC family transcriptional regulator [Paenibacillus sp. YPD9-1]UJF32461.1 AraC family transcriptional regulator [Paenibacillus sp. YPD9-1]